MKKAIFAVLMASGMVFAASGANAQINPQSNVTLNLTMDAFQSVLVTGCTATVTGSVSGNRVTVGANGVTFSGAGFCPAVTFTSDFVIDYSATSSSTANISVNDINTTSVLGTCNQTAAIVGTADLNGGSAAGAIAGTPSACNFGVVYTNTPAFLSF